MFYIQYAWCLAAAFHIQDGSRRHLGCYQNVIFESYVTYDSTVIFNHIVKFKKVMATSLNIAMHTGALIKLFLIPEPWSNSISFTFYESCSIG